MAVNLEQAEALLKEYADLIKDQQGEIVVLRKEIKFMQSLIDELKFELSCELNKEYDV